METLLGFGAVVLLVGLTALFVASEFAMVAVERPQIDILADRSRRARLMQRLLGRLSFHLSGAQLGITVAALLLGLIAESTIGAAVESIFGIESRTASVAIALAIATVLTTVLGELVPKGLAIARPARTAISIAPFVHIYGVVAKPFIAVLDGLANTLVRLLGVEPADELRSVRSLGELAILIRSSGEHGTIADEDRQLLDRTIRFSDKDAADALVPRLAMTAVPATTSVGELSALAIETGHSRIPVYGKDLDDIVGVVEAKDVYRLEGAERASATVAQIMREPTVVPETRPLDDILMDMRADQNRFAVVVDEHGGTAGLISLEDLLEEIVGDIEDEYDPTLPLSTPLGAGRYVLEASLHHDEVEALVGFDMPDGEYETLAGFILDCLGYIPDVGDRLRYDGWEFEVLERDRLRIASLAVRPPVSS